MRAVRVAASELRRFRGPIGRLVPVTLTLIPLLYGAIYLWANWEPYHRLERVPVAVVNQDRPVRTRGQTVNAGRLFTEQLRHHRTFDWHFVDAGRAREGLEEGDYYFTITVPADFSRKLISPTTQHPRQATARVTLNDANGYIAGIMAKTVRTQLEKQINAAAYTAYAKEVLGDLVNLRGKLNDAAEGAAKLEKGSARAQQGSARLVQGLTKLHGGANRLATANDQIATATGELDDVVSRASQAAIFELPALTQQLVDGATTAHDGSTLIAHSTSDAATRADRVLHGVKRLGKEHPKLRHDKVYRAMLDRTARAAQAAHDADAVAQSLRRQTGHALEHARDLQQRTGELQATIRDGAAKVTALDRGAHQAASGAHRLENGLGRAVSGEKDLHHGIVRIHHGSSALASGLSDAVEQVPALSASDRAKAADVLGSPTALTSRNLNPAHVYGRGMAPFFFGIALWVAGLLMFQILRPLPARALASRLGSATVALAGWLPAAAIGVAGALVLYAVIDLGLGLDPLAPAATVGVLALAAAAFVALNHLLRVAFGVAGSVAGLILLMLQLTACGGLYPMETTPEFFQALHPIMPMTYLVDALRVTISGGLTAHLVRAVIVLGGVLVASIGLTMLVTRRRRRWTMSRLKPALEP